MHDLCRRDLMNSHECAAYMCLGANQETFTVEIQSSITIFVTIRKVRAQLCAYDEH